MATLFKIEKFFFTTAILLSVLLVAGCSGSSSDSSAGPGATSGEPMQDTNTVDATQADTNTTNAAQNENNVDTGALSSIPVTFNITVPKYVSNALQVRLQWEDMDVNASWVSDELWILSSDLPANTESQLVVTFSDNNGAVPLGLVETVFKTNDTGTQLVDISASQFDTAQLDNDGDGVSNLDELLAGTNPMGENLATAVQASYELVPAKTIRLSWSESADADYYRVLVNPDGVSGYERVSNDIIQSVQSFDHRVALYDMVNASYIVQACNIAGCVDSDPLMISGTLAQAIGYFKASNTGRHDRFGSAVSVSTDGRTLAVAAVGEAVIASGVNNFDTSGGTSGGGGAGAVYVFTLTDNIWVQQAYVKPSISPHVIAFGSDVAVSGDGHTMVVGAFEESNGGQGINPETTGRIYESGAAFVFVRDGESWSEQAYIKASNPGRIDYFGGRVAINADGNTIAVAAHREGGLSSGVNGDQTNEPTHASGAVYIFERGGTTWRQDTYVKASNPDHADLFGRALSLSADGDTLAVGAMAEESSSTGINGDQTDNSVSDYYGYGLGAVYLYRQNAQGWYQQAYIKASNGEEGDKFGSSVSLSASGNVLAVGAYDEDSVAVGVDGEQTDNTAEDAGAAYVFEFSNGNWSQQAYLKASNAQEGDNFGIAVSISHDGETIAVGAPYEDSPARGINDRQDSDTDYSAGAAYVFSKKSGSWQQKAYVKGSNSDRAGYFGYKLSLTGDGKSLAVGSYGESSDSTGVNGDQLDKELTDAGAVYLY